MGTPQNLQNYCRALEVALVIFRQTDS